MSRSIGLLPTSLLAGGLVVGDDGQLVACRGAAFVVRSDTVPLLLEVEGLSLQRAPSFAVALPKLSLLPGEAVSLCGPSGSGKSSVLHALFANHRPDVRVSGRVQLFGSDTAVLTPEKLRKLRRERLCFIVQDAMSALDPLQPIGRQIQQATNCTAAAAAVALSELGIDAASELVLRYPHQISGGQAQRVLLAVAQLRTPELVVADEPSTSLDDQSMRRWLAAMQTFKARGAALLLATHDRQLINGLGAQSYEFVEGAFRLGSQKSPSLPVRARRKTEPAEVVLAAVGIGVEFGASRLFDGLNFTLHRGEIVAVTGASGVGKTTLAKVLALQLTPQRGTVQRPLRATAVQMVFQDAFASLTPGRTLASLLAEVTAPGVAVRDLASALQLPAAVFGCTAAQMSGGERRRAALLRALAADPEVLILDEPFLALDPVATQRMVLCLLELCERRGVAMVLITHDHELARAVADRVLELSANGFSA
ncbi:MAG: ATP-binding cassette domain-containing protein [Planctomycetota bacterium]